MPCPACGSLLLINGGLCPKCTKMPLIERTLAIRTIKQNLDNVNSEIQKIIKITNKNKSYMIRTDPYKKDIPNAERIKTTFIEDYFTKPIGYQDEEELRIIFVPMIPIGTNPIYVECKQLLQYCEILD
jgi:hypothetical protein